MSMKKKTTKKLAASLLALSVAAGAGAGILSGCNNNPEQNWKEENARLQQMIDNLQEEQNILKENYQFIVDNSSKDFKIQLEKIKKDNEKCVYILAETQKANRNLNAQGEDFEIYDGIKWIEKLQVLEKEIPDVGEETKQALQDAITNSKLNACRATYKLARKNTLYDSCTHVIEKYTKTTNGEEAEGIFESAMSGYSGSRKRCSYGYETNPTLGGVKDNFEYAYVKNSSDTLFLSTDTSKKSYIQYDEFTAKDFLTRYVDADNFVNPNGYHGGYMNAVDYEAFLYTFDMKNTRIEQISYSAKDNVFTMKYRGGDDWHSSSYATYSFKIGSSTTNNYGKLLEVSYDGKPNIYYDEAYKSTVIIENSFDYQAVEDRANDYYNILKEEQPSLISQKIDTIAKMAKDETTYQSTDARDLMEKLESFEKTLSQLGDNPLTEKLLQAKKDIVVTSCIANIKKMFENAEYFTYSIIQPGLNYATPGNYAYHDGSIYGTYVNGSTHEALIINKDKNLPTKGISNWGGYYDPATLSTVPGLSNDEIVEYYTKYFNNWVNGATKVYKGSNWCYSIEKDGEVLKIDFPTNPVFLGKRIFVNDPTKDIFEISVSDEKEFLEIKEKTEAKFAEIENNLSKDKDK